MKILIVEDEAVAAKRLQKMILDILPEAKILKIIQRVDAAIIWFSENESNPPELVFMDIQLADGNSFEIFKSISIPCPVIFTTAFDEFAIQAIKVNALDYLLKPIKKNELEATLQTFEAGQLKKDANVLADLKQEKPYKRRFLIRFGKQIKLVRTEQIAFLYTESKLTYIITFEGKRYPLDTSLDHLDEQLDSEIFFRANRQYILNMNAIHEMFRYSKSRVKVTTKPASPFDIIVSTERSSKFKSWLAGEL